MTKEEIPLLHVKNCVRTCPADPSQWEIELFNGKYVYVRFRNDWFSMGQGDSIDEACDSRDLFSKTFKNKWRLTTKEMIQVTKDILDFKDSKCDEGDFDECFNDENDEKELV